MWIGGRQCYLTLRIDIWNYQKVCKSQPCLFYLCQCFMSSHLERKLLVKLFAPDCSKDLLRSSPQIYMVDHFKNWHLQLSKGLQKSSLTILFINVSTWRLGVLSKVNDQKKLRASVEIITTNLWWSTSRIDIWNYQKVAKILFFVPLFVDILQFSLLFLVFTFSQPFIWIFWILRWYKLRGTWMHITHLSLFSI